MKMDGRRVSSNVDDRRKKSTAVKAGGIGLGGIAIAVVVWLLSGQSDISSVIESVQNTASTYIDNQTEAQREQLKEELAMKCAQFLASTEDFWSEEFEKVGGHYPEPKMVLYSDTVTSYCGHKQSKCIGPFYCPADGIVYIDIDQMVSYYNSKGETCDLVFAEIIGHEVGHHVENVRGELEKEQQMANRYGVESTQFLRESVRIELLADYYAGCWAHFEKGRFGSVSDEEIRITLDLMPTKGDDYIQKKAQGYVNPDSFTHGTSEQRFRWFKKGLDTGDVAAGRVLLTMPYDEL